MLKNNPIINLLKYTWRYSLEGKKLFIFSLILLFIANLIALAEPMIIGQIFDSVQFSASDPKLLHYIFINLILLLVLDVVIWIFHGPSRTMERKNAFLVKKNYTKIMFSKVMDLPIEWHKDHHSGDTIDKINKASDDLFNFSQNTFQLVENFIGLFGSIIILLIFDWRATIISTIVAGSVILIIIKFDKKLIAGYKEIFKAENALSAGIYDYISNIITIITLRLKPKASDEIEKLSMASYAIYKKNSVINELKWFSVNMCIKVMVISILVSNAYHSYNTTGVVVLSTLFILYKYLENIGRVFYQFAWQYGELVRQNSAVMAAEVINEEYKKIALTKDYHLPKTWQTLQIKDLFFSYKNKEVKLDQQTEHIDGVNFTISRGEKIAMIGESGSGKSTVMSLLRGLHLVKKVKVFCDGKKLTHGLEHLYQQVILIPQEPEIFNNTIEENILMGQNFKPEQLTEAIKIAQFDRVVARLKNGIKTNVMEKGVSLSGGEKQRLALARGLLVANNYDFILLDEPTSSVDSENELLIYKTIFAKFSDKIIISSIHRLHLLRYFDYIYYFKDGKIVAEGNFTTMLTDENFKKLWEDYNKSGK